MTVYWRRSALLAFIVTAAAATAAFGVVEAAAFTTSSSINDPPLSLVRVSALSSSNSNDEPCLLSRSRFLSMSSSATSLLVAANTCSPLSAGAQEQPPPQLDNNNIITTRKISIDACPLVQGGKPSNCISTSSVKQVDCYAPPWTFDVSPEEAVARLKGAIVAVASSDPTTMEIVEQQDNDKYYYIKARTLRRSSPIGGGGVTDEMEFVINPKEQVVTFRSAEVLVGEQGDDASPSISDFGANRKRLEDIRKRAGGIFGVMGEGLNTADSYGNRGTGPLQQLKAFYGLQSGGGYEEVFQDD